MIPSLDALLCVSVTSSVPPDALGFISETAASVVSRADKGRRRIEQPTLLIYGTVAYFKRDSVLLRSGESLIGERTRGKPEQIKILIFLVISSNSRIPKGEPWS